VTERRSRPRCVSMPLTAKVSSVVHFVLRQAS
jgi:hypothetical protein